jgi:hypothetical protein
VSKVMGTWWRRSPPEEGGGVQRHGTRGSVGALTSREAGSEAAGHVVVHLAPYLGLKPVCGGYPVYKVPTVVPELTSEEVAKPQVGPTYLFSCTSFLIFLSS